MVHVIAISEGNLRFDSQAGKIGECRQRLATTEMFLRSYVAQALSRGMDPATHYTFRRNVASIMKI